MLIVSKVFSAPNYVDQVGNKGAFVCAINSTSLLYVDH